MSSKCTYLIRACLIHDLDLSSDWRLNNDMQVNFYSDDYDDIEHTNSSQVASREVPPTSNSNQLYSRSQQTNVKAKASPSVAAMQSAQSHQNKRLQGSQLQSDTTISPEVSQSRIESSLSPALARAAAALSQSQVRAFSSFVYLRVVLAPQRIFNFLFCFTKKVHFQLLGS